MSSAVCAARCATTTQTIKPPPAYSLYKQVVAQSPQSPLLSSTSAQPITTPQTPHNQPLPSTTSLHSGDSSIETRDFAVAFATPPSYPRHGSNESLLPLYNTPSHAYRKWMGRYKSEEAYLEALRAWADDKLHTEPPKDGRGRPVGIDGYNKAWSGEDYVKREQQRSGAKCRSEVKKVEVEGSTASTSNERSRRKSIVEWMRHKRSGGV